jgi:hypothetical protein
MFFGDSRINNKKFRNLYAGSIFQLFINSNIFFAVADRNLNVYVSLICQKSFCFRLITFLNSLRIVLAIFLIFSQKSQENTIFFWV